MTTAVTGRTFTLHAWSDNEYAETPDAFVVTITPELARRYLRYMDAVRRLKAEDPAIYSLRVWDAHGEWQRGEWDDDERFVPAETPSPIDGGGLIEELARTECDTVHACEVDLSWSAFLRHTDVRLTTDSVGRDEIEELAKGAP